MNNFEEHLIRFLLEVSAEGTGERVGRALRKRIGPNQPVSTETLTDPETEGQRASTPAAKFKSKQNYKHPQWRAQNIKSRFVDRAYNKSKTARDARGGDERGEDWSSVTDAENKVKREFDKGKEKGERKPATTSRGDTWVIDKRGGKTRSGWKYGDKNPGV